MVLEKTEDSMDILRGIGVITAFFISIIVLGTRYHLGSWIEPFLGNIWLFVKIIGGIILLYLSISVVLQALKTKKKEKSFKKISLKTLINSKESENLEFKSTLVWNILAKKNDKNIEDSVLKTIAAFNNQKGGTLLIGVNDDGEVLGLNKDFEFGGLKNVDKFERKLRSILKSRLKGTGDYLSKQIKVSFPEWQKNKEICRVDVSKGSKPLYTKEEKLFTREGNSTVAVPLSETHQYVENHFKKRKTR